MFQLNYITLQTNVFIASGELLTSEYDITLRTNAFIPSDKI